MELRAEGPHQHLLRESDCSQVCFALTSPFHQNQKSRHINHMPQGFVETHVQERG
jgi:hypothetical protein